MSKISTKPSGGSGEMLWRAGAGGTETPKLAVSSEMSKISEKVSLLISAGQALAPPGGGGGGAAEVSTAVLKPSQSGSLRGTGQGGRAWVGLGQFGQLSELSGTPSPSLSRP